ncbi:MAG: hypothetical protein OEM97_02435 [Acidimicrobiia bacterium]|nr:hypothetical protein [Acidimicrobiia bacterium]
MSGLRSAQAAIAGALFSLLLGTVLQIANLRSMSEPAAILRVGVTSSVRPTIEAELGPVPLAAGDGHDGQFFFVSARDPLALNDQWTTSYRSYRHRRIAYPLVAGLGGMLSPDATVIGLAVVPILGLTLAAAAAVLLARSEQREIAVAAVLANPGLWLSASLAIGDAIALGAGLAGLASLRHGRLRTAIGLLVVAAFAKETYLTFAFASAAWLVTRRRNGAAIAALGIPTALMGAWLIWLNSRIAADGLGLAAFDWPFVGVLEAAHGWSGGSLALIIVTLSGLLIGVVGAARSSSTLLRLTLAPWILIAAVSSETVWRDGNNATRVLAPLLTVGILSLVAARDDQVDSTSRRNLPV